MIEQILDIQTPSGSMTTFIAHPEREAPHPVILFFMDAPGIREELRDMVRRLASVGYYVMLPNLYYRRGVLELADLPPLPTEPTRARMFDLMGSLSIPLVMADADALMEFAARDPAASPGRAGVVGYCMSGQYAINVAAGHPQRIGAAASIYGVKLVTDQLDSPHVVAQKAPAELYFACAEHDDWAPMEMVEVLDQAVKARGAPTEVEIFFRAHQGFAFPQRPVYDRAAAERHWERLFSLFRRRLHGG